MTNLVVPTIGASPDLDTSVELIGPTQKVAAQFSDIFGGDVIKADDKQGIINNLEIPNE
jgi:hypothetical protein